MKQEIIDERYELLEHIGSGGMAEVYKARDIILDRLVAIKVLNSQFASDAEFVQRFQREAQGAARLTHSNIVGIFDVGESDGRHYIVMEYVSGNTLKKLVEEKGKLSVVESVRIAKKIAAALEMAHKNNLVHCDIKPHNILVTAEGVVKVADFGIARAVSASTLTYNDTVVGSVHYFSPEQAKGTQITPKSDVYSLGVVLYEMITGKLPFNGSTPISIALKHVKDEPVPVREIDSNIPAAVDNIIARSMEKEAELRPDSTEMFNSLEAIEKEINGTSFSQKEDDPFATQLLPRIKTSELDDIDDYDEEDDSGDPIISYIKRMLKSKKVIAGIILVLALGFLAGAFLSYGKFWSASEVEVPNVVGKPMALAKQILEDKNLRVKFAETFNADVSVGNVVSQYPEANSKVKEQRQVTIYISKGGEEIEMPDLKGMTRSNAEEKLKKIGLKLGSIYEKYSSGDEAGTVIAQDPRSLSKINKGQTVDLTVSKGEQNPKVVMPDFSGATLSFAKTSTDNLKLRIGSITKKYSNQPEGTIIGQSIPAGSVANEGAKIDFVVSLGAAEKTSQSGKNRPPKRDGDTGKTK